VSSFFQSSGVLRYGQSNLVLDVDQGVVDYYRALMPKSIRTNRQLYNAHISVVRKEVPPRMELWGKYAGEVVEFIYGNEVFHGTVYYWLNAFSKRLEEVRAELGLPVDSPFTKPPEGFLKTFHITLGNCKPQG
jgi:hypothetical protein